MNPSPVGQGSLHLLVVEDDWLALDRIERALIGSRYHLAAKATSVGQALDALDRGAFQGAILDGNLGGRTSEPIAHRLDALATPFLLVSAEPARRLPPRLAVAPRIWKPYPPTQLLDALDALQLKTPLL